MGFINIIVSSECRISCANNSIVLSGEKEAKYSLQDINSILIESNKSVITTNLLSRMSKENIAVYFCDDKHMPCGILMPYNGYFSQLRIYKLQTQAKKPLIKQLWQSIIKQKIVNQGECLILSGKQNGQKIIELSKKVQSDDIGNIEASVARIYFRSLFGEEFERRDGEDINACLNYGYAIVRGLIARSLASNGFCTFIGIHHHSELNNFNLADDLIEPYRAIVDRLVYRQNLVNLDKNSKQQLFNINNIDVMIDNKLQVLSRSIEIMIDSLKRSLESGVNMLVLPSMTEPYPHIYE